MTDNRINNFDLIRLFAATQVLFQHGASHLKLEEFNSILSLLEYFPGVPIFFIVSGYLISKSWETAPNWRGYLRNRILRIFPALWICLIISTIIFYSSSIKPNFISELIPWLFAQATIFQFYNPDFLRTFGVGVINGSLWTIPVELQFYLIIPFLLMTFKNKLHWILLFILAFFLSVMVNNFDGDIIVEKLIGVSLAPYLFYFLIGILLRYLHEKNPAIMQQKGIYFFLLYLIIIYIQEALGISHLKGNSINIISSVFLGLSIVSLAYTMPSLSNYILRKNDISYGIYIYHMPIINLIIYNQITGVNALYIAITATFITAMLSWNLIESPALKLKKYSIRKSNDK